MSMLHSADGYACCSDESLQCWIYCFYGMPFSPSIIISSWPGTSWWPCWSAYARRVSFSNDKVSFGKFQFILFLHAVLHSDYTTGLSYLMKYPSNIDVMSIIRHSLHLYAPEVWNFHFLRHMMCGCELRRRRLNGKSNRHAQTLTRLRYHWQSSCEPLIIAVSQFNFGLSFVMNKFFDSNAFLIADIRKYNKWIYPSVVGRFVDGQQAIGIGQWKISITATQYAFKSRASNVDASTIWSTALVERRNEGRASKSWIKKWADARTH